MFITIVFLGAFFFIFFMWCLWLKRLMELWGRIDEGKGWEEHEGEVVGVLFNGKKVTGRMKGFKNLWNMISGNSSFYMYVRFYWGDLAIGVDRLSFYDRPNALVRRYCRRVIREQSHTVPVYCDPKKPYDAVIFDPNRHIIRGSMIWFGIKTFVVAFIFMILFM